MIKSTSLGEPQHCSATGERMSVAKGALLDRAPFWDWREHHGVSPVKNQGKCGSCWTFSTVGSLEAHEMIKYGDFTSLSEQQLVDCAGDFDNHGCEGGLPSHAFEYIMHAGGISTEKDYPYFAADHNCTVKGNTFALSVPHGSVNITEGDENELADAIFAHGPVSIAFQVVDGFSAYTSGVYVSDTCKNSTADVNHAVVAVGYGTCPKTGLDYWIVKNSWGADWGDQGFFKIQRGVNMCGVAVCNSFPAVVERINHVESFLQ
jgi:cathepsin H